MKTSLHLTRSFVLGVTLAFLVMGCRQSKQVILQREWTANAEYAGDVWASKIAREEGFRLVVKEGSELLDPVRLVRSGEAHFGVASADRVLQENEGGASLVIIASATCRTPVVFLSRKQSGIRSPQDFTGKKVGIQAGTNTELVFEATIRANGIDRRGIKVVESGWGIQTFLNGDIDVLGAFDYDETVQLEKRGIEYNVIRPDDYGVGYVGTVYFTRRTLLNEDPKLLQRFLKWLTLGWQRALKNPDDALKLLVAYNAQIDGSKERESLVRGAKYFCGENGRLLYSSPERWRSMTKSLTDLGRLKSFNYDGNIDYSFLEMALAQLEGKKE